MMKITDLKHNDYYRVIKGENETTDLHTIIAVHNVNRGPALGGVRYYDYKSFDEQLADNLKLSKTMTYKNALARLDLGGGKSTLRAAPKTDSYWESFAEVLNYINKDEHIYTAAGDVGTSPADLNSIGKHTEFIMGNEGTDSGTATAYGVYNAMRGAVRYKLGKDSLKHLHVVINGLGKVGARLAKFCKDDGAIIVVADINRDAVESLAVADIVTSVDSVHKFRGDVFAPCALGGAINKTTVNEIVCPVVCGGANNQLANDTVEATLRERGIVYVPDYLANAGGVIIGVKRAEFGIETEHDTPEVARILEALDISAYNTLYTADAESTTATAVANKQAEKLFND